MNELLLGLLYPSKTLVEGGLRGHRKFPTSMLEGSSHYSFLLAQGCLKRLKLTFLWCRGDLFNNESVKLDKQDYISHLFFRRNQAVRLYLDL